MSIPKYHEGDFIELGSSLLYQILTENTADYVKPEAIENLGRIFYDFLEGDFERCKHIVPDLYLELSVKDYTYLSDVRKQFRDRNRYLTGDDELLASKSFTANMYYFSFFIESLINTLRLMVDSSSDLDFDFEFAMDCVHFLISWIERKNKIRWFNIIKAEKPMFDALIDALRNSVDRGEVDDGATIYEALKNVWALLRPRFVNRAGGYFVGETSKSLLESRVRQEENILNREHTCQYKNDCILYITSSENCLFILEDYVFIVRCKSSDFHLCYEVLSGIYTVCGIGSISLETGVFTGLDYTYTAQKLSAVSLKKRLLINKFDDLEKDYGLYT